MKKTFLRMAAMAAAALTLTFCVSTPGNHPAYLHALQSLRSARWMIEHRPGDFVRSVYEVDAVHQIDWAIFEIQKAAVGDDRNVDWHPAVNIRPDAAEGRLAQALRYLDQAHADVSQAEDNALTTGSRDRAIVGIEAAIKSTQGALND
jgi:hypothetical protein